MDGMKKRVTPVIILLVFCFILVSLLMSCIHTSGAAYIKETGFEEHQHLLVVSNPVLTAGNFYYLDITLTNDAHKISIVAYLGSELPDVEDRSIENYYMWEYNNGKWLDKSGYESSYITPSRCKKNDYIYSFYIGLDARADAGDWTIKISVDNKDVYSSPLNIEPIHFNLLLFTIYTDGFKLDKNDLPEFFKRHRKINHQEQTTTNKESLGDIESFIDYSLGNRPSLSQIKAFAVPVKKTSLYDELVDKIIKDHPSAQETDEGEKIENYCEVEKTIVVDPHLKVSTKKGVIPPPIKKAYHLSFFSGGVPFLVAFLLLSLAFIPLITSSDVSIDSNSPVISGFTLSPDRVVNGDTTFLNVIICDNASILSVTADMGGIETINLLLSDNSSLEQLWQTVWMVHDVEVGEYVTTITAIDKKNASYRSEVRWSVLPEETSDDNQSSETGTNETSAEGNESFNETTPPIDIDDGNMTGNETIIFTGLNLSLQSDKDVYFVNETVSIDGTVSYNNSLINTSTDLLIVGSGVNLSVSLNVSDGRFDYEFMPVVVGRYTVQAIVSYENETVTEELLFSVQNLSLDNVSEALVSDLYVWDDTDYKVGYVGDLISFYVNYSSGNLSIVNASCLISFDVGNWTMPMVMNYSDGFYVYSRSFEVAGTYEYGVWCSASENKSMVGECVISTTEPGIFEPISQIEVGKPVLWKQRFQAEENLTVNISGYAYNISIGGIISEDDIIVLEKNVSKSLQEYNIDKEKHVLAKEIKDLLRSVKGDPDELQSKQELYQLYSMLKDNMSFEEVYNETYEDIEQYISQFIFEDVDVQLVVSNVSDEVEVEYYTEEPKIIENGVDVSRKQVTVYSDVHYENILTHTSIVESPKNNVKLYWIVNGSYVLVSNATYVDTNDNGLIDRIEWITPHLSNQTYEIVITKAEHLNENREFISDIYNEVYRKDGIWSEPIYHDEYVRVTFERNLTNRNDITFYVRNNQGLDTIVEVYYYDSDEKITEFPIIEQEDFYKVYLTGMTGSHQVFDLKMKNLDNINSAYLEFDYIVDPDTKNAVDSNVADMDGSADKGTETNFLNAQDVFPDSNYMNIQEANTGGAGADEWLENDGDATVLSNAVHVGDPIYLASVDTTNYLDITKGAGYARWYTFDNTVGGSGAYTTNLSIFVIWGDGNDDIKWYIDTSGDDTAEYSGTIDNPTSGWYTASVGSLSQADVNSARLMLESIASAQHQDHEIDAVRLGVYKASTTNYEIDFEYNWSTADFDETNEEVCFYVGAHTGSENLNVSYWTGSAWSDIGDITSTGWTNLTATGLTSSDYTIRLNGTDETSDATQDDWDIDVIMLHTWPTISIPTVTTNTSTGVEEANATLRGYLSSNGSADTYTYFVWDNDASGEPYAYNQSNGLTANLSEFQYDATSLTSGDLYYFNTKANNSVGWDNDGGELTFFTKPEDPDDISVTATTSTTATCSVDKADMGSGATSYTYVRYNTGSAPTDRTEGSLGFNSTSITPEITGLSAGTHYYGSAWAWGEESSTGQYSDTYITFEFNTSNYPVVITNTSTGVEETNATLRGFLQSNGSADTTTGFRYGTTSGVYTENFTKGITANQTEISNNNGSLTSGDLYYYQAWANNSAGFANGGELTFFTKPPATTNLAESSSTNTTLTYTWIEATVGTDAAAYTRIQYKTGSSPTSITDGTNTYNGTAETDDTTILTPGTHYYFSAFSWGTEGGIGNWNDTYNTMDAWTNPGDPTSVDTTNGSTWVNVTFTHGTNGEYTMVRRNASGSADYPADRSSGTQVDNTTNAYANDTGLVAGVTYYYALWTWDTGGSRWCDYQTNITGTATVPNNAPTINSYDLLNSTGSKINNDKLDVNNSYYFTVNITDENGWGDIQYINITAWHDNGSEITIYNNSGNLGGNLNMFLQYKNTTGTAEYFMRWPDDETILIAGSCTDTQINSITHVVNISFKPLWQVRYAPGDGSWDTAAGFNDLNSWNLEINVTDNAGESDTATSEYGVYRYTFVDPTANWIGVSAVEPADNTNTNTVSINYTSNYDFNMTIWLTGNLTNESTGKNISVANNVKILANADLNDDIASDQTFVGIGETNAKYVFLYDQNGTAPDNNPYQSVSVQFNVYIPFGTMAGSHSTYIGVKTSQKT